MRLNDVWRKVNKEIGFYTKETFDKVPSVPGVYAWFYPLRIVNNDPYEFIKEVNTILNYDAIIQGKPTKNESIDFVWKTINLEVHLNFKNPNLDNFIETWQKAFEDEAILNRLRRIIMKGSIFIPPLYVGKTIDLKIRCFQHINGNDQDNHFYKRYTEFAIINDVFAKRVSDLLFVCIKAVDEIRDDDDNHMDNLEGLVEAILKNLSKPVYSVK